MRLPNMSILPRIIGVYKITCTSNGRIYIGASRNMLKRWKQHRNDLNSRTHHNRHLQRAWDKYGVNAFVFETLELCELAVLKDREQFYLDTLKPYRKHGFNIAKLSRTSMGFRPISKKTRSKMSAAKKGKPSPNLGKKFSPEHCANIGKTKIGNKNNNGRVHTHEHNEKVAETKRKDYIATTPDGQEIFVHGLAGFCRDNGLNSHLMSEVALGHNKHHRGWKCRYA